MAALTKGAIDGLLGVLAKAITDEALLIGAFGADVWVHGFLPVLVPNEAACCRSLGALAAMAHLLLPHPKKFRRLHTGPSPEIWGPGTKIEIGL